MSDAAWMLFLALGAAVFGSERLPSGNRRPRRTRRRLPQNHAIHHVSSLFPQRSLALGLQAMSAVALEANVLGQLVLIHITRTASGKR
jgi:hypothetical protein